LKATQAEQEEKRNTFKQKNRCAFQFSVLTKLNIFQAMDRREMLTKSIFINMEQAKKGLFAAGRQFLDNWHTNLILNSYNPFYRLLRLKCMAGIDQTLISSQN